MMDITHEQQQALFKIGHEYIRSKSSDNNVSLANAITCLSDKNITSNDAVGTFWVAYGLVTQNKNEFENIENGLTLKLQKTLVDTLSNVLES